MQPIEGLTPDLLWYTLAGIVGIAGVFCLIAKAVEYIQKFAERKKKKDGPDVDAIMKRFDELDKRIDQIDKKLAVDKNRLDNHERYITDCRDGFSVIVQGQIALINHSLHDGNTDELSKAGENLNQYLSRRP